MSSKILAVGGGEVTEAITAFALEQSKGSKTRVLICGLASENPLKAEKLADELFTSRHSLSAVHPMVGLAGFKFENLHNERNLGLGQSGSVGFQELKCRLDTDANLKLLDDADLFFMSGGDQRILLSVVPGTAFFEKLVLKWTRGEILVMGTSAGLQVMSDQALTGEPGPGAKTRMKRESAKFALREPLSFDESIGAEEIETIAGFGFLKNVVFDQHFFKRKRFNRLYSALFDHPSCVGIGVDEHTALYLAGHPGETATDSLVLGESGVVVIEHVDQNFDLQSVFQSVNQAVRFRTSFIFSGQSLPLPLPVLGFGNF